MAAMSPSEQSLSQLRAAYEAATHGYWLTAEELCSLLGLVPTALPADGEEGLVWRQYRCVPRSGVDGERFWQLTGGGAATSLPQRPAVAVPFANRRYTEPAPWAHYLAMANFLPDELSQQLLAIMLRQQDQFKAAATKGGDRAYSRNAFVWEEPQEIAAIIYPILGQLLPQLLRWLQIPPFRPSRISTFALAYNDRHHQVGHYDELGEGFYNRRITFVYYLHREPRAFTGGELMLYNSQSRSEHQPAVMIPPSHNSIVFFPPNVYHEVLPVQCPSREFAGSRFAINGWIHTNDSVNDLNEERP